MPHHYAFDLALLKMAGFIQEAELDRGTAKGHPARPSRPGPRAWVRAATARLRTADDAALTRLSDCFETAVPTHGKAG